MFLFHPSIGRMSSLSQPGKTSGFLQVKRHSSGCLQCSGKPPRKKMVIWTMRIKPKENMVG